ncbi:MAG: hypothetical protein WCJ74_01505 [bacterium]
MNIYSILMIAFIIVGGLILALQIFGVFDLIQSFGKNPTDPSPGKVTGFPLIRGDGGVKEKSARDIPAERISDKKVKFVSRKGNELRSKFRLTEDGRAAIQRGHTIFVRKLAA